MGGGIYPVPLAVKEGFGLLQHLLVRFLFGYARSKMCCLSVHLVIVRI